MNAIYYHIMHQTTRHDLMWIYRDCPFTLIFIVHTVSANLAVTNYQVQGETIKIYVHIQMGTEQMERLQHLSQELEHFARKRER